MFFLRAVFTPETQRAKPICKHASTEGSETHDFPAVNNLKKVYMAGEGSAHSYSHVRDGCSSAALFTSTIKSTSDATVGAKLKGHRMRQRNGCRRRGYCGRLRGTVREGKCVPLSPSTTHTPLIPIRVLYAKQKALIIFAVGTFSVIAVASHR